VQIGTRVHYAGDTSVDGIVVDVQTEATRAVEGLAFSPEYLVEWVDGQTGRYTVDELAAV
jgi:hypothetical protein